MPVWLKFDSTVLRSPPLTVPSRLVVAVQGIGDGQQVFAADDRIRPTQAVWVASL